MHSFYFNFLEIEISKKPQVDELSFMMYFFLFCTIFNAVSRKSKGTVEITFNRQWIALKMRMNEAKIVRIFQEEEKAGGGFCGKEIKDCEAKNMEK